MAVQLPKIYTATEGWLDWKEMSQIKKTVEAAAC